VDPMIAKPDERDSASESGIRCNLCGAEVGSNSIIVERRCAPDHTVVIVMPRKNHEHDSPTDDIPTLEPIPAPLSMMIDGLTRTMSRGSSMIDQSFVDSMQSDFFHRSLFTSTLYDITITHRTIPLLYHLRQRKRPS